MQPSFQQMIHEYKKYHQKMDKLGHMTLERDDEVRGIVDKACEHVPGFADAYRANPKTQESEAIVSAAMEKIPELKQALADIAQEAEACDAWFALETLDHDIAQYGPEELLRSGHDIAKQISASDWHVRDVLKLRVEKAASTTPLFISAFLFPLIALFFAQATGHQYGLAMMVVAAASFLVLLAYAFWQHNKRGKEVGTLIGDLLADIDNLLLKKIGLESSRHVDYRLIECLYYYHKQHKRGNVWPMAKDGQLSKSVEAFEEKMRSQLMGLIDSLLAATVTMAEAFAFHSQVDTLLAGHNNFLVIAWWVAIWRLQVMLVATTRSANWLPGKYGWQAVLPLLAAPVLALPAFLKKCKSPQFIGLVLAFFEIAALLAYFFPELRQAVFVPFLALIGGGVVRLYAAVDGKLTSKFWRAGRIHSFIKAFAAAILFPLGLVVVVLQSALAVVLTLLSQFALLVVVGFIGIFVFDTAVPLLVTVGLLCLPALLGVSLSTFAPTGISGASFDTLGDSGIGGGFNGFDNNIFGEQGLFGGFDINPANGLPMIGGMGGIDIQGNTFGSNFNDSH